MFRIKVGNYFSKRKKPVRLLRKNKVENQQQKSIDEQKGMLPRKRKSTQKAQK